MGMEEKVNKLKGNFKANRPSIVDLYVSEKEISLTTLKRRIEQSNLFQSVSVNIVNDDILRTDVLYKDISFSVYLKIMKNDDIDLLNISQVLVDEKEISAANKCEYYIKSFIEVKHDFVKAYYAQIKLLSLLSDNPLLIVDCSQWCIYSYRYINQVALSQVDIIDSNLFKIKATPEGTLYTDGLDRFGIKELEMVGITQKYTKACASFMSRLSRYFIENGQLANSCRNYSEVFESPYYACLIDMEEAMDELIETGIVSKQQKEESLLANRMYVSVHKDDQIEDWYYNSKEVLDFLLNNTSYYTSQEHFDNEKLLAQETLDKTIEFLRQIQDENNLMILARNEEISTDWYYFSSRNGSTFILKTNDSTLEIDFKDIINWNYQGITPLHAYSLEI